MNAHIHVLDSTERSARRGLRMTPLTRQELDPLETPAYVFDAAVVRARHAALRAALGTQLVVSLKANSLADLLSRCVLQFADGIELASIGELGTAVGRVSATRFVNNPTMDDEFLKAAAASNCVFIVDSMEQARRIAALPAARVRRRALLRLNAGVARGIARPDHFGMLTDEAVAAGTLLRAADCNVYGVHAFGGSHTFSADSLAHLGAVRGLVDELARRLGGLDFVNLGGGFAEDWEDRPHEFARYRAALAPLAERYTLAHESGRGIFARAGVFVTRVVATKQLAQRRIVACDGGMAQNFLLAATEGLMRKHRKPLVVPPPEEGTETFELQFVGSSCSRQDVIGADSAARGVPRVGDVCVFGDCGAYNSSYTVSNFLSLPAARLYLRAEPAVDA
jgi:diaminopimelate decarboxylase